MALRRRCRRSVALRGGRDGRAARERREGARAARSASSLRTRALLSVEGEKTKSLEMKGGGGIAGQGYKPGKDERVRG